jgi:predicted aspartyl protease
MKEYYRILLPFFIIFVFVFSLPVHSKGQQESVSSFTDQDLERYERPSERDKSLDDFQSPKSDADSKKIGKEEKQKPKRYEIPYKAYEGTSRRIIIPVAFNGSFTAPMALDTGATGMHISLKVAEKLGLFEKDEGNLIETTGGIGGTVPAILTIIDTVQVGKLVEHFVPTKVTRSFSEEFEGLLGMDFMTNFSIHIDTSRHVVVLEELPARSNMRGGHDEEWWRSTFRQFASKRAEWKNLGDTLSNLRDPSKPALTIKTGRTTKIVSIGELKEFADLQYREADKLLRKLDRYAVDHVVPMEWREY